SGLEDRLRIIHGSSVALVLTIRQIKRVLKGIDDLEWYIKMLGGSSQFYSRDIECLRVHIERIAIHIHYFNI
uniref:hypothetical protein n=1 Tax=Brevibacillus agri TaxID=51101 RepID=UPI00056BA384